MKKVTHDITELKGLLAFVIGIMTFYFIDKIAEKCSEQPYHNNPNCTSHVNLKMIVSYYYILNKSVGFLIVNQSNKILVSPEIGKRQLCPICNTWVEEQ